MRVQPKNISALDLRVKRHIFRAILESENKLTPRALEQFGCKKLSTTGKTVRQAIDMLVSEGVVQYTNRFGISFIEPAIGRLQRISTHIVLKSPRVHFAPEPGDIVISLASGASFGLGEHASTRLALKGLEEGIRTRKWGGAGETSRILDIGTGTGVLVIAAVMMGVREGIGIDVDPCARSEAVENVKINNLESRIEITGDPVVQFQGSFGVIAANLRYPTLITLCRKLYEITLPGGFVLLSGIRSWEAPAVMNHYKKEGFFICWGESEQNWQALICQKNAEVHP
jgi:ribosomal protein L11 methyltransferase